MVKEPPVQILRRQSYLFAQAASSAAHVAENFSGSVTITKAYASAADV